MLASKDSLITEKEFKYRFPIEKKEWNQLVSVPLSYDIFFISYNEVNADINYEKLVSKYPAAKRIHGVKGIHQAHLAAAKASSTEFFWVVDADAEIVENFVFHYQIPHYDNHAKSCVYVWFSKNPVNGLEYGYGGVKLLPKNLTIDMNTNSVDMTTSISDNFKVIKQVSNITKFNVDPVSTWRSAFRECAKLASRVIDRNYDDENDERLYIWCNLGKDQLFGDYAISGAKAGKKYGEENIQDHEALNKINDYAWLEQQFKESNNG